MKVPPSTAERSERPGGSIEVQNLSIVSPPSAMVKETISQMMVVSIGSRNMGEVDDIKIHL